MTRNWPEFDYLGWRETCSALHLYLQIAGKYRLAHTPWLNHSWNATFYVTPIGLASSPIPDGPGIEILFDLREHRVVGTCGNGSRASFDLGPTTIAEFHSRFVQLVSELGGTPTFNGQPNEVPFPVPFAEDHRDRGPLRAHEPRGRACDLRRARSPSAARRRGLTPRARHVRHRSPGA
jgi:hypothetical protein